MRVPYAPHLAVVVACLVGAGCSSALIEYPDAPNNGPDDQTINDGSNDPTSDDDTSAPDGQSSTTDSRDETDFDCRAVDGSFVLPSEARAFSEAIGSADCVGVRGNLVVRGELGDLEVLDPLYRLDVRGDVSVETLGGLRDLSALAPLRDVGGNLNVASNESLVSTAGLEHLRAVGDDVRIADNPNLRRVEGLDSLRQIGSDLRIVDNPDLRKVVGFDGLAAIAEYDGSNDRPDAAGSTFGQDPETRDGAVDPHLIITNNPKLEVVRGFPSLSDVDGDLRFVGNDALKTIRGFGRLEFVTGELRIEDQPNLTDISALVRPSCLRQIHIERTGLEDLSVLASLWEMGRLQIVDNPRLERLGDWRGELLLRGPVEIRDNPKLARLDGLGDVERISRRERRGFDADLPTEYEDTANAECVPLDDRDLPEGSLRIEDNDRLESIGSLSLRVVEGTLALRDNDRIRDLGGLSRLESVGGAFEVAQNGGLRRLDGLERLEEVGDALRIVGNDRLQKLEGFRRLDDVDGEFRIEQSPELDVIAGLERFEDAERLVIRNTGVTDLDGFAQLESTDGLVFSQNDAIESLQDFLALRTVSGTFRIEKNDRLASLENFDALNRISDGFVVQENSKLATCEARSVAASTQTGYTLIEDNASCDQ